MAHQTVLPKLILPVDEVLPHQVLCKGECRERELLDHLEPGNVAHLATHGLEDERKIDAALVSRQFALELRDPKSEISLQELEQGQIEPYVVLVVRDSKGRLGGATLKPDRDQNQRRAVRAGISFRLLPAQETRCEKEGVRTTLLHVASRPAVEREETIVHLLAGKRHGELPTIEGIADHLLLDPLRLFGRDGAVADGILIGERKPRNFFPAARASSRAPTSGQRKGSVCLLSR